MPRPDPDESFPLLVAGVPVPAVIERARERRPGLVLVPPADEVERWCGLGVPVDPSARPRAALSFPGGGAAGARRIQLAVRAGLKVGAVTRNGELRWW